MTPREFTEDLLVEQPAIELLKSLGWDHVNGFHEWDTGKSTLGRETKADVVLVPRLRKVLAALNPDQSAEAVDLAIEELTRDRSAMSPAAANKDTYKLLKEGVRVKVPDAEGEGESVEAVRVVDWTDPDNNDFFLVSQFWVTGEMYTRRADLVGFVNGLPLVFMELKASHKRLKDAHDANLTDYKTAIPQLFWHSALVILSNGSQSRVGSMTAGWEHFAEWKRITSEGEAGIVSLETMIRGTCEPARLLDLVENFTLFIEAPGGLVKLLAKNHQFLGVNNALQAVDTIKKNKGKLGVFWHTQGSGKSYSMILFAQKVLRKVPGNWTFVIVTDRDELDTQIYKNFASAGAVTEKQAQAESAANLRQVLTEDHRFVFTLIQKFRTEAGEKHPVLSQRDDIIVIADEAHRTQYDTFALNMRTALPKAAFIAFTGTPLIATEEKTRKVFGDYVSIYNFKQSMDDGATVPLYWENRIPELQLKNEQLNEDIYQVVEEADLDEDQQKKLERELGKQYHLITRDDRLESIAEDIVTHFAGRGFKGKGMVVCIDKATAIRMYDKVKRHWQAHLAKMKEDLHDVPEEGRAGLEAQVRYLEGTDTAVVVSSSQNEIEEMRKKGLDITPHRKRMVKQDLETKFKNPDDPLRLVFVCAMWMTGFDVPSCSTIYLDKPMRNHTLMQTIARANRVFPQKVNGVIVDYVGVFRELQRALAIYGSGAGGGVGPGDLPIKDKAALVEDLRKAIAETRADCSQQQVDLDEILRQKAFARVRALDDATECILITDESRRRYLSLAAGVVKLYRAILPDEAANELAPICAVIDTLAQQIRNAAEPVDISGVMGAIGDVLDRSIGAESYIIRDRSERDRLVDLSKIDFERLRLKFQQARKHTETERLKVTVNHALQRLVRLNRTRADYLQKFQKLIEDYNNGAINVEVFFDRLVQFAKELTEEEQRHIAEQLTEEELAMFDLLTKPDMTLTKKETQQVKKVAKTLLDTLKREKLVLDWRKRQQSRAAVRLAIETTLDDLPKCYTRPVYAKKCDEVFQHVFDSYADARKNPYAATA